MGLSGAAVPVGVGVEAVHEEPDGAVAVYSTDEPTFAPMQVLSCAVDHCPAGDDVQLPLRNESIVPSHET